VSPSEASTILDRIEEARGHLDQGRAAEARSLLEPLLSAGEAGSDALRADLLWTFATACGRLEAHDDAAKAYEAALPLLDRLGRGADGAVAANNLAYHHRAAGRGDQAVTWILDALERRRRLARQPDLLRAHLNAGWYRLDRGETERAESCFRVAVQQARTFADPAELGTALLWLGRAVHRGGRPDRALLAWTESLANLERAGSPLAAEAAAEIRAVRGVPGGAR
jgi:tetratricopeptide (TPR) repeat protein